MRDIVCIWSLACSTNIILKITLLLGVSFILNSFFILKCSRLMEECSSFLSPFISFQRLNPQPQFRWTLAPPVEKKQQIHHQLLLHKQNLVMFQDLCAMFVLFFALRILCAVILLESGHRYVSLSSQRQPQWWQSPIVAGIWFKMQLTVTQRDRERKKGNWRQKCATREIETCQL